jgi:hypothetical protein
VVIDQLMAFGFLEEDVLWALNYLTRARLVGSDNPREEGLVREDYVKILASGFIHLRVLACRFEYLSAVSVDTWLRDGRVAEKIAYYGDLNNDDLDRNVPRHRARIACFVDALRSEYRVLEAQTLPPVGDRLLLLGKITESLENVLRTDHRDLKEDEFVFE